ncbi:MAG: hypothetical protein NTW66_01045 [Candidatus Magasanikbacteria bacterium]|nr:hypothetical protein [Candidatus Magasanikbacteria bacterium]
MPNLNESRKFSPIADTGGIQEEFDVDKFVEGGIKEMSPEQVKEQQYKEWQNTGHNYLLTRSLSERHAQNILRLDGEIAAAGRFGENIDQAYLEDPTQMPGWGELGKDKQESALNFAKLVQERDKLLNEQGHLLQHEKKILGQLNEKYQLSAEDINYELNKHGDSEISDEELDLIAKELEKVLSVKTEQKTA